MEVKLHLLEVGRACGSPGTVRQEHLRRHSQLVCDICHGRRRRCPQVIGGKPQIPEGTELQGKAQAGMGLAVLIDGALIRLG